VMNEDFATAMTRWPTRPAVPRSSTGQVNDDDPVRENRLKLLKFESAPPPLGGGFVKYRLIRRHPERAHAISLVSRTRFSALPPFEKPRPFRWHRSRDPRRCGCTMDPWTSSVTAIAPSNTRVNAFVALAQHPGVTIPHPLPVTDNSHWSVSHDLCVAARHTFEEKSLRAGFSPHLLRFA